MIKTIICLLIGVAIEKVIYHIYDTQKSNKKCQQVTQRSTGIFHEHDIGVEEEGG